MTERAIENAYGEEADEGDPDGSRAPGREGLRRDLRQSALRAPIRAWTTDDRKRSWDLYDLSAKLRERGWQVPAYPMPADITDVTVMRVVVRNGVSMDLTRLLLDDIVAAIEFLDAMPVARPETVHPPVAFHH